MAKQRRQSDDYSDSSDGFESTVYDDEFDLDEDEMFDRFAVKQSRRQSKRRRDTRRRIEEYWEDQHLRSRLQEFYDEE